LLPTPNERRAKELGFEVVKAADGASDSPVSLPPDPAPGE
jgi:hypothetical protein